MATLTPLRPTTDTPTPRLAPLSDLLDDFLAEAALRHEARRTGRALGPVTGFAAVDEAIGGRLAPGLHVVHGGPGIGKTAWAWQVAAQCGAPAIFVTCEMAPTELLARAIARETATYLGRIKSGELPPAQLEDLARRTIGKLPMVYLVDATRAWPSAAWLSQALEVARGNGEHTLLVVDSIHSWSQGLGGEVSEYDTLSFAVDALRQLGLETGTPVLGIAERNRSSMERGGMHASAGSRRFEYAAESLIDLTREGSEDEDSGKGGRAKATFGGSPSVDPFASVRLRVVKNRHGAPARVDLSFEGRCQRYAETDL